MKIYDLIILFFYYAILGYIIEVLEGLINRKEFVNRGFLIGPYCPIYGFGALLMIFLLKRYNNDYIALFIFGSLICTILEYFTSLILEKIFKTRWWDYSNNKINLNGRVCLEVMILFGISSVLLIKIINPLFSNIINKLPYNFKIILSFILILIFIIDLILSIKVIINMKKNNIIIPGDITKKRNKSIKNIIKNNYSIKRLLDAFPLLKEKTRK